MTVMAMVLLVVAGVFVSLLLAIERFDHEVVQRHTDMEALVTANRAERSTVDLETGIRGFLLTREPRFLEPYWAALHDLPGELSSLKGEVAHDRPQLDVVARLAGGISSYEQSYARPLVKSGSDLSRPQIVAVTSAGKTRFDALRDLFARFDSTEQAEALRGDGSTSSSRLIALAAASGGFLMIVLLIGGLAVALQRWILAPVRGVAAAAVRRMHGERGVRVPEGGRGEIASLGRSFNSMAEALEERDRRLVIAHSRLEGILEHTSAIIYIKDVHGRYLLVNRAFEAARDLVAENVLGQTERAFSPPDVAHQIALDDKAVVETGELAYGEYTVPTPRGPRTYLTVKFLIPAPEGGEPTIGGISTDITEHKQALLSALEASRLKSQFVANMSHEIRTPLSGVIGLTNLLRETNLDPLQREYVDSLATSGEALLAVIGDILDFSKIEAGRLDLDLTEFDLRELVEESCLMVAQRAHVKGLELNHWVDADVPEQVVGDRGRLRQILLNLLSNAVKFTSEGEVVVRVSCAEARLVRFEVFDTGIGISPEQTEGLFEAFSQADQSTTRKYGGTGLGLAISRELTALMGGDIRAERREAGGSVFSFTAELPQTSGELARRPASLSGIRALVVDDNETNRTVLRQYLTAWGIECDVTDTPGRALEKLTRASDQGKPFALVLLDYHLPEMDGIELAAAIRDHTGLPEIAILLLSSSSVDPADVAESGIAQQLLKPPRQSDLYDSISVAVGAAEPHTGEIAAQRTDAAPDRDAPLVLIAEDNEVNQVVAATMLRQRGLRTEIANNGLEAVTMSATGAYAAIFMDCQMPELDGYEATKRIRDSQTDGRVPIIAMTANAMPGDRERCLAAGMDDYLAKPLDPGELDAALAQWLPAVKVSQGAKGGQEDTPNASAGNELLLDEDTIARLRQDFAVELRQRLLGTFEEQLAARLPELQAALERHDVEELRRLLHLLKGSSATIGANAFSDACRELEHEAAGGEEPDGLDGLPALGAATITALRAELLRTEPSIAIY